MKKKVFISIAGCITIFVLIWALRYIIIDHSQKVHIEDFVDEEMGNLIIQNARFDGRTLVREEKKIRKEHVENIPELNIGYTGYYNTLTDIKKCRNLKMLVIGNPLVGRVNYFYSSRELPEPEDYEKIKQIEEELGEILTSCSNLEELYICNTEETCNLSSLNFLKKNNSIKWLCIIDMGDIDYSPILECTDLEVLDLDGCNISELGDISKLTNLKALTIDNTNISKLGDISKFTNMESLSMDNTSISELGDISKLTNLYTLDISGTNISELGDISKLTNLKSLYISGTNISEWGDIVKLKNLERLSIKNTPLAEDEEQIELLYETLPDIEIDRF